MITKENLLKWLIDFTDVIEINKSYLSELDTPIGDGDHGNNMYRGALAVRAALKDKEYGSISEIFKATAMALMANVGGASGPLYGSALMEMAKKANETNEISEIVNAGLEGIKKRGKAEFGDKTMVDVWEKVSDALKSKTLTKGIVVESVINTEEMQAKKGRASYVGERSIGHIDPGATSSGYFFIAMLSNVSFEEKDKLK